jgi:hypothetical protein
MTIRIPDFVARRGDTVRVAMTYDQCQINEVSLYDRMQADLDMTVFARGVAYANNSHVDNTEMVQFTASDQTGVSIRVARPVLGSVLRRQPPDPCGNRVGRAVGG